MYMKNACKLIPRLRLPCYVDLYKSEYINTLKGKSSTALQDIIVNY